MAALLGGTEMPGAEAVTDTSLARISVERVRSLAGRHPRLSWAIAEQVATWGVASVATLVGAGFEQMTVRVARHLLELPARAPDGRPTVARHPPRARRRGGHGEAGGQPGPR